MRLLAWWSRANNGPPPPGEHRIGIVKWVDTAAHPDGWATVDEITAAAAERVMLSVGYILPANTLPDHLTVAQDHDPDGDRWNGVTHMPLSCVRSVWYLT